MIMSKLIKKTEIKYKRKGGKVKKNKKKIPIKKRHHTTTLIKNFKLKKKLKEFLKSNKNSYIFSNSHTNDYYHQRDQSFTVSIFCLVILQALICLIIVK